MNELYVFIFLYMLNEGAGPFGSFQMFRKWKNQFSQLNLREGPMHYGEKEQSALFEVRMEFQKSVHLTSPLQTEHQEVEKYSYNKLA